MNEDLLDDEQNKQLIDICKSLLGELNVLIDRYKKIAKSKGIPYDIRGENHENQSSISGSAKNLS
jgi:hypothetical protein